MMQRRDVLGAAVGVGAALLASQARADGDKPKKGGALGAQVPDAAAATAASPALLALQRASTECAQAARVCLARCTDHLASGMTGMAECQRAVMNMLAVVEAMISVAAYRSADAKNLQALAVTCAQFCRTCERACEPHVKMHEECKACFESCGACIKACEAYAKA